MNKIGAILGEVLDSDTNVNVDKCVETVFPHLREEIKRIQHRRPDIIVTNAGKVIILEVTICYDLYLDISYHAKVTKYAELLQCLSENGIDTN